MFDLDAGKLIIVGVAALVFIPSKDLPRVLRQAGQFVGKMKRMANDFQGQFMDAMREADMADLRKEAQKLADSARMDSMLGTHGRDLEQRLNGSTPLASSGDRMQSLNRGGTDAVEPGLPVIGTPIPVSPAAVDVEPENRAVVSGDRHGLASAELGVGPKSERHDDAEARV